MSGGRPRTSIAGREIRTFRIATAGTLGPKRGRGRGAFIDSVLTAVDGFYADVLGSLRAWSAAPPKLRSTDAAVKGIDENISSALSSTDYSSQDEPSHADQPHTSAAAPIEDDLAEEQASVARPTDDQVGDSNDATAPEVDAVAYVEDEAASAGPQVVATSTDELARDN